MPWPRGDGSRSPAAGAAEQLRDATYRVALIYMKLPVGDGAEVFRLVREADPRARTVLITGCRAETEVLLARVLAEGPTWPATSRSTCPGSWRPSSKWPRRRGEYGWTPSAH